MAYEEIANDISPTGIQKTRRANSAGPLVLATFRYRRELGIGMALAQKEDDLGRVRHP